MKNRRGTDLSDRRRGRSRYQPGSTVGHLAAGARADRQAHAAKASRSLRRGAQNPMRWSPSLSADVTFLGTSPASLETGFRSGRGRPGGQPIAVDGRGRSKPASLVVSDRFSVNRTDGSLAPTDGPARLRIPNDPLPIAWVLHDGKAGMASRSPRSRAKRPGFRLSRNASPFVFLGPACRRSYGSCRCAQPGVARQAWYRPGPTSSSAAAEIRRCRPSRSGAPARAYGGSAGPVPGGWPLRVRSAGRTRTRPPKRTTVRRYAGCSPPGHTSQAGG